MLRGKIKWFSTEKGFGFITHSSEDSHTDYFFHISSLDGPDAPDQGDLVEFQETETRKGKAAQHIRILEKVESRFSSNQYSNEFSHRSARAASRDDRVECKHCGKRMVPRIQFSKGEPIARLCPFCMQSQEDKWCFIATSCFNDERHSTVQILRQFRDQRLLNCRVGQIFVSIYFSLSPHFAKWLEFNPVWKPLFRKILTKLANILRLFL